MSDILLYAALKENDKLTQEYAELSTGTGTSNYDFAQDLGPSATPSSGSSVVELPDFVAAWKSQIDPFTQPRANGFKVCDTSGYFRCGSSCGWTVPTGVTSILLQMWAPGGSTGSNCCCGGAPFGVTGQYSAMEVAVCPGESFYFCSGCAYCCYANQTTNGLENSPTDVCGCNFRAMQYTPTACFCNWNCDWSLAGGSVACNWQLPNNDGCGPTGCDGYNFCWDSGEDNVDIPFIFSRCSTVLCCDSFNRVSAIYKIPAIWPRMYIPTGNLNPGSYSISGPVYGFEDCTCCRQWTGTTCKGCYYRAQDGYQQIPAVGGYASTVFGGCDAGGGDAGGMGMICVSWNCD